MNSTILKFGLGLTLAFVQAGAGWANEATCRGMGKQVIDTDLQFSVTHSQIPGELAVSTHKLRVAGTQYKLESTSQAKGLLALLYSGQLTQKSEGLLDSQTGLTPLYYAEQRGKKPVAESMLNAETQRIQFKRNGESAPYEKGLQDRLSMVYQIAARLRCNSNLKAGDTLPLRVMSTGRLSNEVFTLQKTEDISLNLGKGERRVSTLVLETTPETSDDEIVRIWYAKDLNWQPVKIQIQDNEGKTLTQTLISTGKS
ncbi:DUF3108 domain-containing protein [Limnobacter parvus]|uniref:DUF3108 domain-containing protein n=1 Tax=Limnobacter parvus TaxID=2939690 RepID=A0ABT1XFE5_9BURK|nr:DUF3108 domain-containing protein [Limnobacter parvus]MCR2745323.1 DUF3108 domain-containing protein [Limnobacter parvus]